MFNPVPGPPAAPGNGSSQQLEASAWPPCFPTMLCSLRHGSSPRSPGQSAWSERREKPRLASPLPSRPVRAVAAIIDVFHEVLSNKSCAGVLQATASPISRRPVYVMYHTWAKYVRLASAGVYSYCTNPRGKVSKEDDGMVGSSEPHQYELFTKGAKGLLASLFLSTRAALPISSGSGIARVVWCQISQVVPLVVLFFRVCSLHIPPPGQQLPLLSQPAQR